MAAGAVPASAASWGVGVGYGPPIYYEAPPRVYYGAPPVLYEGPPGVFSNNGLVRIAPGVPVLHMEAAEDVLARLASLGYHDFAPMRRRGARYFVRAIDRRGDLVALQISIFTGQIERADVLEVGYAAPPPRLPRSATAPAAKVAVAPPRLPRPAAQTPTKAAVAPPRVPAPAKAPEAAAAPASTLKGRLKLPPAAASATPAAPAAPAPSSGGDDPLVVY